MINIINGEVVNVIVSEDMPVGMPEHVWENHDGSYTMKLNAVYNHETLQESFLHAVGHIAEDDFHKEQSADEIEAEAHGRQYAVVVNVR